MVAVSRDFSQFEEFLIIFNDICVNCPEKQFKGLDKKVRGENTIKSQKILYLAELSISFTCTCINVFLGGKEFPGTIFLLLGYYFRRKN